MQIINKKLNILNVFRKLKASSSKPKATQHQNYFLKKNNFGAGFTLLFASLIGSLVFTIGIAILNISLKQLTLTSAGRESQQSFYSADAGVECALFLDRGAGDSSCLSGFFGIASITSSTGISACDQEAGASVTQTCFGQSVDISYSDPVSDGETDTVVSTFNILQNDDTNICFSVSVIKITDVSDPTNINTTIESRGYNRCGTEGNVFERVIKTFNY